MNTDPGLLSELNPSIQLDLTYKRLKNIKRQQGSMREILWRPSRAAPAARPYVFGDPVRSIDWRAFARTDSLIVREDQPDTAAYIQITIDAGSTMFWPDEEIANLTNQKLQTKFSTACRVGLALAFNHLKAQDIVSIKIINHDQNAVIPAKTPKTILEWFADGKRSGFDAKVFTSNAAQKKQENSRLDLEYLITDGLATDLLSNDSASAVKLQANTILIQTLSFLEIERDWLLGDVSYFENVAPHLIEYPGVELLKQNKLQNAFEHWLQSIKSRCSSAGSGYLLLNDQSPISSFQLGIRSLLRE